jgi:hypothetical protein
MNVVILERNKLVARRAARHFATLGATVTLIEEPNALAAALQQASLVCADSFDGDVVVELLRHRPTTQGLLWTAEPLKRSLKYLQDCPAISHVLARKDFESPPRSWELLLTARRLLMGDAAPPFAAYLDWGAQVSIIDVATTEQRDSAVVHVQDLINRTQAPKRVAEMFGELAHELLMNAMYDAPVDADGRALFAADRKAHIALQLQQQPTLSIGIDGSKVALQVRDPFGRLQRHHVVAGLLRGLSGGEMDHSHGGAGLGMMVCHNSAAAMFFDVVAGRTTEVSAIFELDLNLREFRTAAKSLHVTIR